MSEDGYGFFEDKIVVGSYKIECSLHEDYIHYSRAKESSVERSKIIKNAEKLELLPIYPVFLPLAITKYVIVYFTEALNIPPSGNATIYIKIPVDISVYAYDANDNFTVIDVFAVSSVKYALYGPIEEGIIARYYKSEVFLDPVDPKLGEALARIKIVNKTDSWVEIGKVLLDSQLLRLHYKPRTWEAYTQEIAVNILACDKAIVNYLDKFVKNVVEIRDPEGFKPPRLRGSNEMIWGLR